MMGLNFVAKSCTHSQKYKVLPFFSFQRSKGKNEPCNNNSSLQTHKNILCKVVVNGKKYPTVTNYRFVMYIDLNTLVKCHFGLFWRKMP